MATDHEPMVTAAEIAAATEIATAVGFSPHFTSRLAASYLRLALVTRRYLRGINDDFLSNYNVLHNCLDEIGPLPEETET